MVCSNRYQTSTVVNGITGRYVAHFVPSGRGTGQNIGLGYTNVVAETDSWETLRAIGCGTIFLYYITIPLKQTYEVKR